MRNNVREKRIVMHQYRHNAVNENQQIIKDAYRKVAVNYY